MHKISSTPATASFTALNADEHDCLLGYRSDAKASELYEEAMQRQHAVLRLLGALSGAPNLDELQADCLNGCFQAIRILCSDTAALHAGAYEAIARESAAASAQFAQFDGGAG